MDKVILAFEAVVESEAVFEWQDYTSLLNNVGLNERHGDFV